MRVQKWHGDWRAEERGSVRVLNTLLSRRHLLMDLERTAIKTVRLMIEVEGMRMEPPERDLDGKLRAGWLGYKGSERRG